MRISRAWIAVGIVLVVLVAAATFRIRVFGLGLKYTVFVVLAIFALIALGRYTGTRKGES